MFKKITVPSQVRHMDMKEKPRKLKKYAKAITWIISYPLSIVHRHKVTKVNMEGIQEPYFVLGTHQSFLDFTSIITAIAPRSFNIVADPEAFLNKETLVRDMGCLVTRKFIGDVQLVKQIKYSLTHNKDIVVLYPEARFSMVGTHTELPPAIYKLVRMLQVPVVVMNSHGNYLSMPVWRQMPPRFNRTHSTMTQVITAEEIKKLSVEEIKERIDAAFSYDEYAWQKEQHIKIRYWNRAKGLSNVLYQCPNCNTEYQMDSKGTKIFCKSCNKVWKLKIDGDLEATSGDTEFVRIPDWFEWQRKNVIREIDEGRYHLDTKVKVESFPNPKKYIPHGDGRIIHDENGFRLEFDYYGEPTVLTRTPLDMYSVPVKYPFFHYKSGFALSFPDNSFYLYPYTTEFSPTKVLFATEELYKRATERVES